MSRPSPEFIALCLASPEDEALWKGIFETQHLHAIVVSPGNGGLEALGADSRLAGCAALVVDAPAILAHGIAPAALAETLRAKFPRLSLFVRLPGRAGISGPEQAWARAAGIASLLPGSTVAAWQDSIAPVLARVLESIGIAQPDVARLRAYLDSLVKQGIEPRPGVVNDIHADAYRLERAGLNSSQVFERMQQTGGVAVCDLSYRGKAYRECFVASEAVDWIESTFRVERALAARLCRFLWRTGRIHHVLRDAEFTDAFLFFRFGGRRADFERVDLRRIEAGMRDGGLAIGDRTYLGKTYARCFVGAEACDWLERACGLKLGAAETVGQWLLELGVLHHVLDAHGFLGGNYFYRYRADEMALAAG
jgi:hypothetical protein